MTRYKLKTIGMVTRKRYKCTKCGNITWESTNHYGKIYDVCRKCGNIGQVCMDKLPKGWGRPPEWKVVRLGDVAEIKKVKKVV